MVKKKFNIGILVVIVLFILVVREKGFLGATLNPPIEVPFTYQGYNGIGHYTTAVFGSKEGGGSSSFNVNDQIKITHSQSGNVYDVPFSMWADFELYINTLKNLCVGGEASRSGIDSYSGGSLVICTSDNCIQLFSISAQGNSGSWSDFKCLEMEFKTVGDTQYLLINDGLKTEWKEANNLNLAHLYLKGYVSGHADNWESCSSSIYIENLEPYVPSCSIPGDTPPTCDGVDRTELGNVISGWISDSYTREELGEAIQSWVG
jgi:hypothetical protein